jgi:hypothetical protein
MSKQTSITGGISALLQNTATPKAARVKVGRSLPEPKAEKAIRDGSKNAAKQGLRPGETRFSFIANEAAIEKIKALAYWTPGASIKDLLDAAIGNYLTAYEKKNGAIRPVPKK